MTTAIDSTVTVVATNSNGLPNSDTFLLGGDVCPGRCSLISGQTAFGWDERAGYAQTGATLVPKGDPLNAVVFRVDLWEGSQWAAYQAFAAKYLSSAVKYLPGTTTPRALGIYHPVVSGAPHNISEVVVDHVTMPIEDEDGMYTLEIHLRQYRAPVLALGKAEAAIPASQNPTPTAQDAAEAEAVQQASTLGKLAGQL